MPKALTTIAFDADDTLWHNERFFHEAQGQFFDLLAAFGTREMLHDALLDTERRNIPAYGFGIKGFTLSMMETALAVSGGALEPRQTAAILALGRDMLAHPVDLLDGVAETLASLHGRFDLMVITKGDLFDQERKLAHSGLADFFGHVEIVSDKTMPVYRRIFDRHAQGARRAMMVGNSLKSDVIPAIEAGAWGVHMPHGLTWALEHAEPPQSHPQFRALDGLQDLLPLVEMIADGA
jgi:putative hydrolase of the HAD superfamily